MVSREIANVFALPLFSPAQCDRIIAAADPTRWQEGRAAVSADGREGRLRTMQQQLLPVDEDGAPAAQIAAAIGRLNAEHWGFALTGLVPEDRPWLMRYDGARADHFDWHLDLGPHNPTRKLSFSVQLTDGRAYDGGDLEFTNLHFPPGVLRERGTLVVFPSFLTHRVTATTRGVRHAAVGWVHGPVFT